MIKKITMDNIKGRSGDQLLTGRDIITGRNGAGKTTRLQALSLAMLGYVPGIAKQNAAIFEMSSDDKEMVVGLTTDDIIFSRAFQKKSKLKNDGTYDVKFSQEINLIPSLGESTIAQKEERIRAAMGNFPVMLDFNAFISMTDMQQRDFIYSLSGNSDVWDREYITNRVREQLLTEKLYQNNPELYEAMEDNVNDVTSCYLPSLDMNTGILAMVERAKKQFSYWKQEKLKADSAAKKLAEMKNSMGETDRDLNDNIRLRDEKMKAKEELISKLATYAAENTQRIKDEAELADLQAKLASLDDEIASLSDEIATTDELLKTVEEFRENAKKSLDIEEEKLQELKDALQHYSDLDADLASVRSTITTLQKLIADMKANDGFCVINKEVPCAQNFAQYIEKCEAELAEATDKGDYLLMVSGERDELKDDIKRCEKKRDDLMRDISFKDSDIAKAQAKIAELEAKKSSMGAEVLTERIEALEKKLEDSPFVDIEPYQIEKKELEDAIAELNAKIEVQKKQRDTLASIRENMIDSNEADFQVLTWKQIVEVLGQKGIQGEIVKQMLDPIKDDVSAKLRALQDDDGADIKEFYFKTTTENGKENFIFGWTGEHGDIPFSSLSNGEQLLLLVALMVVVIEKSGAPIKVLALDNLDKLDKNNLRRVIKGIDLIGGNMDNVILAGVMEVQDSEAEGWTITRL